MIPRYIVTIVLGSAITFGLFYLMRTLIHMDDAGLDDKKKGKVIEFVRLKRDETVNAKERKLPDKTPPEEPPPPPDLDFSESSDPDQSSEGIAADFAFETDLGGGPAAIGAATDGDVTPLVRVEPIYPLRAEERGIEGWVEVEFTISSTGTVKSPKVTGYHPSTIFNQAALRAIRRWKYNPKVEDGKPVPRPGVKVRLAFRLSNA